MVGDDDQSIYGFRGANSKIMLGFSAGYPDATVYRLSTNYRCSNNIINAAGKVIEENKVRYPKKIVGASVSNMGESVEIKSYESIGDEDEAVVGFIKESLKRGLTISEIAIFLRTNREASRYAELLRVNGLECSMEEKAFNPYKTEYYKVFANYLKLASDGERLLIEHLFPIMNKPSRFIRRDIIRGDSISFDELVGMYKNKTSMTNIVKTFRYQIGRLKEMDLYSGINYIRKGIRLDEYMKVTLSEEGYAEYIQVADWIMESSRKFSSIEEFDEYAMAYEERYICETRISNSDHILNQSEGDMITESKEGAGDSSGMKIRVMTYHASKGLEFDTVILPHVNEGSVPHKKSVGEEKIEEERRLFYVAMTRAKKKLIITYVKGTKAKPVMMSRFLYCLVGKRL